MSTRGVDGGGDVPVDNTVAADLPSQASVCAEDGGLGPIENLEIVLYSTKDNDRHRRHHYRVLDGVSRHDWDCALDSRNALHRRSRQSLHVYPDY
jgi:hypothetical protein